MKLQVAVVADSLIDLVNFLVIIGSKVDIAILRVYSVLLCSVRFRCCYSGPTTSHQQFLSSVLLFIIMNKRVDADFFIVWLMPRLIHRILTTHDDVNFYSALWNSTRISRFSPDETVSWICFLTHKMAQPLSIGINGHIRKCIIKMLDAIQLMSRI